MKNRKTAQTANQIAELKVEFRIHFFTYLVVNALLAIINLTFTPGYKWFIWPLLGWGMGIFFHALNVYFAGNTSIRERLIEQELKKD